MDILIIRHAKAEDPAEAAKRGDTEFDRALTEEGVQQMRAAAESLRALVPEMAVTGHSPLRRARETAEIVAACYPQTRQVAAEPLAPGGEPVALERWLAEAGSGPVAVVGHEPDLGQWIARLLSGRKGGFSPLKKGGICCLRCDGEPRPGGAVLQWLLPPRVLRALGRPSH